MKRLFLTLLTLGVFYVVTFAAPVSEVTARVWAVRFYILQDAGWYIGSEGYAAV
jgi:hypothetical protein